MDAKQTFDQVVVNYNEAKADPTNFIKLCNALASMNMMPEQLALQQVHYSPLTRDMLDQRSAAIRKQHSALEDVKGGHIINGDFARRPDDMGDHPRLKALPARGRC